MLVARMKLEHYKWLLTAAPAISYDEQRRLETFVPKLTPIALAVRRM